MKSLTREAILRMTGTEAGSGIGTPGTGGGGNTAGLASESWVDENYLSKEFFKRWDRLAAEYKAANIASVEHWEQIFRNPR